MIIKIRMSDTEKSKCFSPEKEAETKWTPDIVLSDSDKRFFQSLHEFVEEEKKYLQCPDDGPDEQRYSIYSSVFNQVIGRATAYKRLLLAIKTEYDDVIRAARRRGDTARAARRTLTAAAMQPDNLLTCRRRAAQLRDSLSLLQKQTAGLQRELQVQLQSNRERRSAEQNRDTLIPGLSLGDWEHPEVLVEHLQRLQGESGALQARRRRCVSLQVKTQLDAELKATELQRERLSRENNALHFLNSRLRCVSVCLSCREAGGQQPSVDEFLCSTLENLDGSDELIECECSSERELFEDDEPTKVNESHFLSDYLDRFLSVFEAAQYEEAALLAARSPRGVLRNLDTMEMFRAVQGPPSSPPPLLLFFQALLVSVPPGGRLSAALSLQAGRCALEQGSTQLISQAVSQHRLTCTEALGDALTEHAQKNPGSADLCLASATAVYQACRLHRKTALSMCRRGLIHNAADFINHCPDFTTEDCLWLLSLSPSLSLLQLLTEPRPGRAAILSVGGACGALLRRSPQELLGLQLLDDLQSRGLLQEAVLQDGGCSAEVWADVASLCAGLKRADLSRDVLTALTGPEEPVFL